jgi:NAD(P)-dependent dehydrogenase (short-subunit alcohol dehydrogenase family)
MNERQLLKGKHAVIFGAGGSFGSVVAKEFAAEGAEVFLSGRLRSNVEEVAKRIVGDGGTARAAAIDAADPAAVDAYVDSISRVGVSRRSSSRSRSVPQTGSSDKIACVFVPVDQHLLSGLAPASTR